MILLSNLMVHRKTVRRFCMYLLAILALSANAQIERTEGVKQINGTRLFVKIIGQGEPLVIVHGGPGLNHTYFLPHLESLAKHYRVIFYDQRTCGR